LEHFAPCGVNLPMKYVMRRLLRSPMFTAIALVTLAVGIGANTAIFSVIDGVLIRPLPYPNSDRLVGVWLTAPGLNIKELNPSPSTYFTYREEGRTFEDIGLWNGDSVSVTGQGDPEQVRALDVTDGTLPILGVKPALGRWFSREDDAFGSPKTIILSHSYWQRKFGGERSVIGRRIIVDAEAREVIGVMPKDFRFLDRKPELILPMQFNRGKVFIGNFSFHGVARLKPEVTIEQANADNARMIPMMALKFQPPPGMNFKMLEEARIGPNVRPLKRDATGDVGNVLWVFMGTIGTVLFIACANVANLLLVRAEGRQHELSIRAALGAGWGRIARELLYESVALGVAGGLLGLGLAYAALKVIVALGPGSLPRLDEVSINPSVLLFTIGISLFAGVLFGLVPVFKYAGPRAIVGLREAGRSLSQSRERHRARSVLVIVQVSLALVLLISAGLMIRTVGAARNVQPGFTRPEEILTLRVSIPSEQVKEPERVIRMENDMLLKVSQVAGVSSAALTNSITMDGDNDNDPIFAQDRSYSETQIPPLRRFKFVSPAYFHTMGNPLLAGRDFTWADIYEKHPVVLISEKLARELWHDPGAAIGKRIRESPKGTWREIVGVTGNERDDGANQPASTTVYWPILLQNFWSDPLTARRNLAFAVRSNRTGSAEFLKEVQKAVWSVNPEVPVADVRTVQEIYDKSMARTSFTLTILGIAAGMALLLGMVGIYGVISYSVSQQTRDIGIRMALGAQHQQVSAMFVRHGLILTLIGVACGLAAAAALMRLMSSLLFEVNPMDPATYAFTAIGLIGAAVLASYLPARRATTVDPAEALRAE
jgi:putative ABC transport system permease protein